MLGAREDGYHELRMVMQSCSLADEVYVERAAPGDFAPRPTAATSPAGTGTSPSRRPAPLQGAGRAGGRGDSHNEAHTRLRRPWAAAPPTPAAVLAALNELHGGALGPEGLFAAALEAGSDVPFCLLGGTALAEGRGERLQALSPLRRRT